MICYSIDYERMRTMQETILVYKLDEKILSVIQRISSQLGIEVREIKEEDITQKMGYILGYDGFERLDDIEIDGDMDKEFLFFAHMTDQQLDILLDVFKAASIPMIPYKAKLTESNLDYLFYQLYRNVEHEYKSMAGVMN